MQMCSCVRAVICSLDRWSFTLGSNYPPLQKNELSGNEFCHSADDFRRRRTSQRPGAHSSLMRRDGGVGEETRRVCVSECGRRRREKNPEQPAFASFLPGGRGGFECERAASSVVTRGSLAFSCKRGREIQEKLRSVPNPDRVDDVNE